MQHIQKIKVIHIYKDFDIYNGLIETFMIMAKEIDDKLFDFKVCVFNYSGSSYGKKFREVGGKLDSLDVSWEDNPVIIWRLYRYLKRERPHIVQTYILKPNLYGRIAAKLARVPVIISTELTLKDQAPTKLRRIRDVFLHPVNSFLNKYTDVIICASQAIKKQWQNEKTKEKLAVVYPPFDMSKLSSSQEKAAQISPRGNGNWVIGTVGRLSEEKRHVDLLKAFVDISKKFPGVTLLIVGDGYLRQNLERRVDELGIKGKVTFTGFQENVYKFLGKMDIFVLPSRTEGSPLSIFEAMAIGLPVIATNIGGIPEIVINEVTGLLVALENTNELSRAIVKLLSNPDIMKKMGEEGRARVITHFHPNKFISHHESIYKELVNMHKCLNN